jgi:hypothetical protein
MEQDVGMRARNPSHTTFSVCWFGETRLVALVPTSSPPELRMSAIFKRGSATSFCGPMFLDLQSSDSCFKSLNIN